MCQYGYNRIWLPVALAVAASPLVASSVPATPPKPLRIKPPAYTVEARKTKTQGTVVLSVRVNEQGDATEVTVLSRLGSGLDESAKQTVSAWRFEPARNGDRPVSAWTTVKVDFRLAGIWFDQRRESERTAMDLAEAQPVTDWQQVERLAKEKFPPAQHRWGQTVERGLHGRAPDIAAARILYEAAAAKYYPPAIFELGRLDWGQHPEEALRRLLDASAMGSVAAQRFLGERFASGDGVPRDLARAQRLLRLCATEGDVTCRLRLASLLRENGERGRAQAIAWLELAAADGSQEAGRQLGGSILSERERAMVDAFKNQFEATAVARR